MRYILDLKFNKIVAFFGLLILNSKALVVADQKNLSTVKMHTFDDPCNVNGTIYTDCKTQTKSYYAFTDCMEKVGNYSTRAGDKCCPYTDGNPKQYYDCEPTPPPPTSPPSISSSSGITWWEASLIALGAAITVGVGVYKCVNNCSAVSRIARNALPREDRFAAVPPPVVDGDEAANPDGDAFRPLADRPLAGH